MLQDAGEGLSRPEREEMAWTEGLLTAAAIGPERTRPEEWAKAVFGPETKYEDAEQAQASAAMLALLYNKILVDLRRMREDYAPFFLDHAEDGEKIELATQWADGFVSGMRLRGKAWDKLVGSGQGTLSLAAIVTFLPGMLGSEVEPEERAAAQSEALMWIGPAVFEISEYWTAHARRAEPMIVDPFRKIGRNEPCPCGSGKKHKKCCLDRLQS
jgi:uncharacterized protein